MKKFLLIFFLFCTMTLYSEPNGKKEVFNRTDWEDGISFYLDDSSNVKYAVFSDPKKVEVNIVLCDSSEYQKLKEITFECKRSVMASISRSSYEAKNTYMDIVGRFRNFAPIITEKYDFLDGYGFVKVNTYMTQKAKDQAKDFMFRTPLGNVMDISILSAQNRDQPREDNPTYQWIKNKFGVTFSWDIPEEQLPRRLSNLVSLGTLPDMVEINDATLMLQQQGYLRDLKPLIEKYAPNLMKHYSSAWRKMMYQDSEKDDDGRIIAEHIYSLPNYGVYDAEPSDTYFNGSAFYIQKAVLKEFGYPVIKTIDEYFDLIEKYYTRYPVIDGMPTIPFNIITYDWEFFDLVNPPKHLAGYPDDGNGHVINENGKYRYVDNFTDQNAKKWFKLENGYYQRGLIDPSSFTDNRDQYYAKISQGRVLGMFIQGWQFMYESEEALLSEGKYDRTYVPLPITFDETIKPRYYSSSLPNLQRGYAITTNCPEEKAIKILQFMDVMLEEENQKVLYWGFEGEDYFIDVDGSKTGTKGAAYRTQAQRDQQREPRYRENHFALLWREEAPKLEGKLPGGYVNSLDDLPWEYACTLNPVDLEVLNVYGVSSYVELMNPNPRPNPGWYPLWQSNPNPENGGFEEDVALAGNRMEDVQRKYLPKLIMCKPSEFDKLWDEYVAEMKPLTDVYNSYMQEQLDSRVEFFGGE